MASRVVEIRDAVATWLGRWLTANDPGSATITTARRIEIADQVSAATPAGRTVFVLPLGYSQVDSATRETDTMEYRVGVVVVERYPAQGDPPDSWADGLSAWVEANVYNPLNSIGVRIEDQPTDEEFWDGIHCETGEVVEEYDIEALTEHRLFWSESQFAFREES